MIDQKTKDFVSKQIAISHKAEKAIIASSKIEETYISEEQIESLFATEIKVKGVGKKLDLDKFTIYNYRNRCTISVAEKLFILVKLDAVTIQKKS